MTDLHTFNEEQEEAIRALRRSGMSWNKVARVFNVRDTTVRRAVDPEYRERRAMQIAANKSYASVGLGAINGAVCTERRKLAEDAAIRMSEIPDDTRNLTARICGDPLPGRSALDMRRA